jgi:hypothetical protein
MADIFLSYANQDVDRIKLLVEIFERQGWSVWWDYKIRIGKAFDQVIEEEIAKAKCLIVLWSNESVKSDWVKSEADEGKKRHILAPVLIDNVAIPIGFRRMETAKLYDWKGDLNHPELKLLLHAIAEIIGEEPKLEEISQSERQFSFDFIKSRIGFAVSFMLLALIIGGGFTIWYLIDKNSSSSQPASNINSQSINSTSNQSTGPSPMESDNSSDSTVSSPSWDSQAFIAATEDYARRLGVSPPPYDIVVVKGLRKESGALWNPKKGRYEVTLEKLKSPGLPKYVVLMGRFLTKNYDRCIGQKTVTDTDLWQEIRLSLVNYIISTEPDRDIREYPVQDQWLLPKVLKRIENDSRGGVQSARKLALALLDSYNCESTRDNLLRKILDTNTNINVLPNRVVEDAFTAELKSRIK